MLGFTKKFFLLTELDYKEVDPKGPGSGQYGWATWEKLGYEAYKGVIPYLMYQGSQFDDSDPTQRFDGIGAGVQWLPRPHFDFSAEYQKQRTTGTDYDQDYAWLLLHYYL
jgi:hypothetical protein